MGVSRNEPGYWAFISYSHRDEITARWLHRSLETYRVPRRLRGRVTRSGLTVPQRLTPVFLDREELAASSSLPLSIRNALDRSQSLVVLCSPSSAESKWVNEEIRYFEAKHGRERVFCVLAAGEPDASSGGAGAAECLPPTLRGGPPAGLAGADAGAAPGSPLAADLRQGGQHKQRALLGLVAGILSVDLGELVQRDRRRTRVARTGAAVLASLLLITALWAWRWREEVARSSMVASLRVQLRDEVRREHFTAAAKTALGLLSLGDDSSTNRVLLGWSITRAKNRFGSPGFEVDERQVQPTVSGTWSRDGDALSIVDDKGQATIYAIESDHAVATQKIPPSSSDVPRLVAQAQFGADRNHVITDGLIAAAGLWDVQAGRRIDALALPSGGPLVIGETLMLVMNHRGDRVAGATRGGGAIAIWETGSMRRTDLRAPGKGGIRQLRFSSDDGLLVAADASGAIAAYDAATGRPSGTVKAARGLVDFQLLPGRSGAVVLTEAAIRVEGLDGSSKPLPADLDGAYVQDIAVDSHGGLLAGALSDGRIALWDLGSGARRSTVKDQLASAEENTGDLGPPIDVASYRPGERVVQGMARVSFAGDDHLLVGMHTRGKVCVWAIDTLETLFCMNGPRGRRLGMSRAAGRDRFVFWGESLLDFGKARVVEVPVRREGSEQLRREVDGLPPDPAGPN